VKLAFAVTLTTVLVTAQGVSAQTLYGSQYMGPSSPAILYLISPATGASTPVGPIGEATVSAIAFAPDGVTLYGNGAIGNKFSLVKINTSNGASTKIGDTGIGIPFQDMSFRPSDGTLFAYGGGYIFTVNLTTGVAAPVGYTGKFPLGNALAFSAGGTLYNANEKTLDIINQSDGSVTSSIPLDYTAFGPLGSSRANAMKFHPNGTLYASIATGFPAIATTLGTINTTTGVVTPIGLMVLGVDGLAIGTSSSLGTTPVPSSWMLAAIGMMIALLYGFIRRRRSSALHAHSRQYYR